MNRREWLATAGVFGMTALAGCSSAQSVVRTGPPNFENVEISGPESVEVGDSIELEVTAKNTGGEAGDFTTTLTVGKNIYSVDRSVEIESIPVGEKKSTTIGPFEFDHARSIPFRITDHAAEHLVEIQPLQKLFGDEASLWDGIELAIKDMEFAEGLYHEIGLEEPDITAPETGNVFAILYLSVKNTSDERQFTPTLQTNVGEIHEMSGYDSFPTVGYIEGSKLDNQMTSGQSGDYWAVVSIPRSELPTQIEVAANRGADDSRPEVVWSQESAASPPHTELTNVQVPSSVEIGSEFEISATLENTGGASTRIHTAFRRQNADSSESYVESLSFDRAELGPGESTTVSTTNSEPLLGDSAYWIEPFEREFEVGFEPAIRDLGEVYTAPNGVEMEITDIRRAGEAVFDDVSSTTTYEADDGNELVLAKLVTRNPTDDDQIPADQQDFAAVAGGETYGVQYPDMYEYELMWPVEGTLYTHPFRIDTESTISGWLLFEVPESVSESTEIRWRDENSDGYAAVARWS